MNTIRRSGFSLTTRSLWLCLCVLLATTGGCKTDSASIANSQKQNCQYVEWTVTLYSMPGHTFDPEPYVRTSKAWFAHGAVYMEGQDLEHKGEDRAWWLHRPGEPIRMGKIVNGRNVYIEYAKLPSVSDKEDRPVVSMSTETEKVVGHICKQGRLDYRGQSWHLSVEESISADSIPDVLWMHQPGVAGAVLRMDQSVGKGAPYVEARAVTRWETQPLVAERFEIPKGSVKVEGLE